MKNENIDNVVEKTEEKQIEINIEDNSCEKEAQLVEKTEEEKNNDSSLQSKKNLKFWVGLTSGIIVLIELIGYYFFKQEVEVKLIIDCISMILAILVFVGILKPENNKAENIEDIKEEITSSISDNIKKYKEKNKKDK